MCAWNAKSTGGYAPTSTEALENVEMLARALSVNGWSKPAIAALLGNGAGESGLNPWRWESDYVPTYAEFANWTYQQSLVHGYGLFGFTPASSYINSTNEQKFTKNGYGPNFSDRQGKVEDGEAQIRYFISTVKANWTHNLYNYYADDFANIGVDISNFYNLSFDEFRRGKDNDGNEILLEYLTGAFELCYEKPADWAAANSYSYRVGQANYWYDVIKDMKLPIGGGASMDIMFYLKSKNKRMWGA